MSDTNLEDTQTIESKYDGNKSDRSSHPTLKYSPNSQSSLHDNTEPIIGLTKISPPPTIPLLNSDPGGPSDFEQTPTHHFSQEAQDTLHQGSQPIGGGEVALSGLALLKRNSLRLQGYKVPEPVKQGVA